MSSELETIVAWYPGHMAKAARRIREYLAMIDIVIEVVDARIPRSGRNPSLDEMAGRRRRILALNREDLADSATTKRWLADFSSRGLGAVAVDGRVQRNVARIATAITRLAAVRPDSKGISRALVVGMPNSGKSSIVNGLIRRAAAKTEDRAGVTRQLQWFRLSPSVELMDTPGVLPPKIPSAGAQWKLAICGAVPRDRYDPQEVAGAFHRWLVARHPKTRVPSLQAFASARGFKQRGGEIDYHNAAQSYIRAFNDGAFGRISLESPDDAEAA
jgi:ribosome biogenesis GTPase A